MLLGIITAAISGFIGGVSIGYALGFIRARQIETKKWTKISGRTQVAEPEDCAAINLHISGYCRIHGAHGQAECPWCAIKGAASEKRL